MVKAQELALWTDPKASAIALGVVHLFFAYLAVTSNTTFNLGNMIYLSSLITKQYFDITPLLNQTLMYIFTFYSVVDHHSRICIYHMDPKNLAGNQSRRVKASLHTNRL